MENTIRLPLKTVARYALPPALMATLIYCACGFQNGNFTINTKSPNGQYRVLLQGSTDPQRPLPLESSVQTVKLTAFKESQVVAEDAKFLQEGAYDELFLERYPRYEWVNDSVLRLGHPLSDESFSDQLVVTNRLKEEVRLVTLNYGKHELFFVFNLAPGSFIELRGSPQFRTNMPASSVYFQARTPDGLYSGNAGNLSPRDESVGPIKLVVEIVNH